jgi:hypothetical protein
MSTGANRYSFQCPHCGIALKAKLSLQGQTRPCAGCHKPIVLPTQTRTLSTSQPREADLDLQRSLGLLAANAADIVQKTCCVNPQDAILLNSLFMYLPDEHNLGDAGDHLAQSLQHAWKICRTVRQMASSSEADVRSVWLDIYQRMKIYVPDAPRMIPVKVKRRRWSIKVRRTVWERFGKRCYYCGDELLTWRGQLMHLDHVTAIANGGQDEESNLVPSCAGCNLEKGKARFPEVQEEHRQAGAS